MNLTFALSFLTAYLLGSIPFPYIIARAVKGIDLRTVGSFNVGGRNLKDIAFSSSGTVEAVLKPVPGGAVRPHKKDQAP